MQEVLGLIPVADKEKFGPLMSHRECAAPSPVQGSYTHVQVKNSGKSSPRGGSGGSPEPPS